MTYRTDTTANREIEHGRKIARYDPERVWGWKTPAGQRRARRRAEVIADSAHLAPGVNALEIGCGSGLFTAMFIRKGARLLAVDISTDLLAQARRRELPVDRVLFLEKRFEDCDVQGPFDAVVGSSVLHHLDLERSLEKIYGLLRSGGIMSFAEPNMLNPQILVQKNITWLKHRMGDSPDETAFYRWSLRRLMERAGFRRITITPFDWLHPATPPVLVNSIERAGKILERLPVIREFAGSLHIVGYKDSGLECRRNG